MSAPELIVCDFRPLQCRAFAGGCQLPARLASEGRTQAAGRRFYSSRLATSQCRTNPPAGVFVLNLKPATLNLYGSPSQSPAMGTSPLMPSAKLISANPVELAFRSSI